MINTPCKEHKLRMSENRALRRIFGPKRDEMVEGSRKVYNEELHNLYSSPSIIIMIKSMSMRWVRHVAIMGRRGVRVGFWWESQEERDHWSGLHGGERIIQKLIMER
jgi:hypothetical protein